MPGHYDAQLIAGNRALARFHPRHLPSSLGYPGDFALLNDIHTHIRAGARVAPGHRIVTCGARPRLPQSAQHRIARPVDIDDRA